MGFPLFLLGLLFVGALGCDDEGPFIFESVIVDADAGNPAAGTDATTLRVGIQEGDLAPQELEFPITDGLFDASLAFESFASPTRVRISIQGPTTDLVTAPPTFVPALTAGVMRVVAVRPSSCVRVEFNFMEAPRASFGMVQSGTFALLVGGTGPAEPQVEFLDALEWGSRLFQEDLSLPELGPTRAASVDPIQILVLPGDATAFVFNMEDPLNRVTSVVLHAGAGPRSALVSVPGVGAMVIGGELGGEPQTSVSLVTPDGDIVSLNLSAPRAGAVATAFGADVLVVGGDTEGTAELLRAGSSTGAPVTSTMDGVREGGTLVGDGESRGLLVGGVDDSGTLRTDTVRFDSCPNQCVSAVGPPWPTARLEVLQPAQSTLLVGGTDSAQVEEVVWNGDEVAISPLLELNLPRAAPGGIVFESGAFIVGGGNDGVSTREDFEFCAPAELAPL